MKAIAIDLAPSSLARSCHRLGRRGWLLLAAGLLLCGAAVALGAQMLARQRALEGQLELVRATMARKAPPRSRAPGAGTALPVPTVSAARATAVNAAIGQLNLPWPALRDAVGAATPASVALLALEPDGRRHSLKITAETRDAEAMIAYVVQLKRQPLFGDVVLLRHEINEADPNRPLRFEVDAPWRAP